MAYDHIYSSCLIKFHGEKIRARFTSHYVKPKTFLKKTGKLKHDQYTSAKTGGGNPESSRRDFRAQRNDELYGNVKTGVFQSRLSQLRDKLRQSPDGFVQTFRFDRVIKTQIAGGAKTLSGKTKKPRLFHKILH